MSLASRLQTLKIVLETRSGEMVVPDHGDPQDAQERASRPIPNHTRPSSRTRHTRAARMLAKKALRQPRDGFGNNPPSR